MALMSVTYWSLLLVYWANSKKIYKRTDIDDQLSTAKKGPVSRKPRKLFGPVKPFLVYLYMTSECIRLKTSFMKGTFVHIKIV